MEWLAFHEIEPFGDPPADWRAATIASAIAAAHGTAASPAEFMPDHAAKYEDPPEPLDDETLKRKTLAAFGVG
jgi:hypothetical protein